MDNEIKSLDDFLNLPNVDDIVEEVFVSERLGKFKVKAMTADEHNKYIKMAKGKISKNNIDFDSGKFNLLICIGQTVFPDFNNAELLRKAGCPDMPEMFIKKKLLAGEIAELATQICKISGFDTDLSEDIKEAKN